MAGENFKTLEMIDGEEYIFNSTVFGMELKRLGRIAKKTGSVASIEEYRNNLADKLAVSPAALKQWESGRNGVADLDRVKEISQCLMLGDYRKLLMPKIKKEKELEERTMMARVIDEQERNVARKVFEEFVDVLFLFRDTNGFTDMKGEYHTPTEEDVLDGLAELEKTLRKSTFDLPSETYQKLLSEFMNINCDEMGAYPDIFNTEEFKNFLKENNGPDTIMRAVYAERKFDEYFERLCEIMGEYMK